MVILFKSSFRSIKKHLLQYLGLLVILTLAISIFSAMFSNNEQLITKYNLIYNDPLRPTHTVNSSQLELLDDKTSTDIDLIPKHGNGQKWENNNSKLVAVLEKIEKQFDNPNFNCYLNAEFQTEIPIDPLLCQIHHIFSLKNNVNNKKIRNESIINWRLLLAGQENNLHPSLIFKGRIKKNAFQEFDVMPIFDLNNSNLINNSSVVLTKGRVPKKTNEIVISETFSYTHKIKINDRFVIKNKKFIVTGIGNNYLTKTISKTNLFRTLVPEVLNPKDNGVIYTAINLLIDKNFRQIMKHDFWSDLFLTINGDFDIASKNFFNSLREKTLIDNVDDTFIKVIPERLANNFVVQNVIFISLTFISMSSLVLIVLFFIRKEINDQQNQIGILKSFGYKSWQIAINFIGSIWAITTVAAILAFFCSLIFQKVFSTGMLIYNFGLRTFYFDIKIILIFFFLLPLIFTFVCWMLSVLLLRMPVLTLIYRSQNKNQKIYHFNKVVRMIIIKAPFSIRLSVAFFTKSFGKWLVTGAILLLATFILSLQYLTVDTLSYKINSYHSEWNVAGSITYNNQFNWREKDQLFNQKYEYISSTSKDYQIKKDWSKFQESKDDNKASTIYCVFNDNDNKNIEKIFKIIQTILKNNDTVNNGEILMKLSDDDHRNLNDFRERFNLLKEKIKEQYKFKIAASTINIFWQYQDVIIALEKLVPKEFSFKKIIDFINIRETFQSQNIAIDNLDVTMNYISYDEEQDFLLNRYDFKVASLDNIRKINSEFPALVYSLDGKAFNNTLNIANKDYYYQELYFDNPQTYKRQKDPLLPAIISKNYATYREHNYKTGDIIADVTTPFGVIDIKVVGIADNIVNEWAIITNQALIERYFTIDKSNNNFLNHKYFNFVMSKNEVLQPLRSVGLYYDEAVKSNFSPINQIINQEQISREPLIVNEVDSAKSVIKLAPDFGAISIFRLAKQAITNLLKILDDILYVIRYVTISIIAIVLILLISMIIDDSIFIIATMKILGYHLKKISALIMGWYLISTVIFFSIGIGISYLVWYIIGKHIFNLTGVIYTPHIYLESLLIIITIFALIICLTYFAAIIIISRKNVLSLQN